MGILDASDTPLRIMTCRESIEVLPGKRSEISAYRVERDGKIYLNPTIGVRTGANFSTELANGLDEDSTVHWHGLHVDWRMDGHPPYRWPPTLPTATPTRSRTGVAPIGITPSDR
jgi:blue copper oxidase